jgi:formiminoglutamase
VAYSYFEPCADLGDQINKAVAFFRNSSQPVGIEVDLDSIVDMPTSAVTPSGLSVDDVRFFIRETTSKLRAAYLHLPEGAPASDSREGEKVGKSLAYLVTDFIKSYDKKPPGSPHTTRG